jgi:hypothetical protein
VSESLATLPWVEKGSIEADRASRSVKFTIKDKSRFNLDEIQESLSPRYRKDLTVVSGPDDKTSPSADNKSAPPADKKAAPPVP